MKTGPPVADAKSPPVPRDDMASTDPSSSPSAASPRPSPRHPTAPRPLWARVESLLASLFRRAVTAPSDERVWTAVLMATAVAATVWLFAQILLYRYGRDQGIYACVAESMLRGGMPYRDAWDFKPPGIFVVFALARAILGPEQWAIRLLEVLGLASMIGAFVILARRFFGDGRIGVVGGALAVLVHAQLEFWHTAQPESFGGILTVWAIVLATYQPSASDRRGARKEFLALFGCGALYAAAGLLKPPALGGIAVSAVFVFLRRRASGSGGGPVRATLWAPAVVRAALSTLLPLAVGSVLTISLCALWFVAKGAWPSLYQTLFVFTPYYSRLGWEGVSFPGLYYLAAEQWMLGYSSINSVGLLAALIMRPASTREREGVLHAIGVAGIQLAGVAIQRKFFPYHYASTLPLSAFVAGLGLMKLWQVALARGVVGMGAYAVSAYVVLLGRTATRDTSTDFMDRCLTRQAWLVGSRSPADRDAMDGKLYSVADVNYDANRRVARLLRDRLRPDESVFIWGFEPIIYDLAGRKPASRYLYDVPQRVSWFRQEAQNQLMADLSAERPAAIVVEHHDVFPVVTGNVLDSADSLRSFPALWERLEEDYVLEVTIEDFDVYFRRR